MKNYDGATNGSVLAIMGSTDAADSLTLNGVANAIKNTLAVFETSTGCPLGCTIPVEIGPINSLVPLLAAAQSNGDGAGRAVPELPQTTFSGSTALPPSPCALASDQGTAPEVESAVLHAGTAAKIETLAGGVVAGFGGYSGIALWPSNVSNGYALSDNYLAGTLTQAWTLGRLLLNAATPLATAEVARAIEELAGRGATATVPNFYITAVTQSTTSGSLDSGIIRLDNAPVQSESTQTHYLYNLNENLIMYSTSGLAPDAIAPDSICYYSETTGRGFSNANDDLAVYFDATTGKTTGNTVSVIRVRAAPQLYAAMGVMATFADLLRNIGYAGAMPKS